MTEKPLRSILQAGIAVALLLPSAAPQAQEAVATSATASASDVTLLAVYISMALVFSFACSVAEAVLLSTTPSYIAELRKRSPGKAERLHKLKVEEIDRSLAAILTVNTIAHTVGAIGAGAKATAFFGSAWFGVFSAVMTLLILFLSEIVPKTLGAVYWRRLTGIVGSYVKFLILTMYPLIWISEKLTQLIAGGKKVQVFSRDEFVAMADVGKSSGQLDERESKIIRNLFRFKALKAEDIMTPRVVMVALPAAMTVAEAHGERIHQKPFSRLPIYGKDKDDIQGFVLREDILSAHLRSEDGLTLGSMQRDLITIPESMALAGLMDVLLTRRQHIAIAVGEFGETRGLVTLEDLVETLLGEEIIDESDHAVDMQAVARRRWRIRAKAMGLEVNGSPGEHG
jgi:CBS domain containing-hemolysin-like protein